MQYANKHRPEIVKIWNETGIYGTKLTGHWSMSLYMSNICNCPSVLRLSSLMCDMTSRSPASACTSAPWSGLFLCVCFSISTILQYSLLLQIHLFIVIYIHYEAQTVIFIKRNQIDVYGTNHFVDQVWATFKKFRV